MGAHGEHTAFALPEPCRMVALLASFTFWPLLCGQPTIPRKMGPREGRYDRWVGGSTAV